MDITALPPIHTSDKSLRLPNSNNVLRSNKSGIFGGERRQRRKRRATIYPSTATPPTVDILSRSSPSVAVAPPDTRSRRGSVSASSIGLSRRRGKAKKKKKKKRKTPRRHATRRRRSQLPSESSSASEDPIRVPSMMITGDDKSYSSIVAADSTLSADTVHAIDSDSLCHSSSMHTSQVSTVLRSLHLDGTKISKRLERSVWVTQDKDDLVITKMVSKTDINSRVSTHHTESAIESLMHEAIKMCRFKDCPYILTPISVHYEVKAEKLLLKLPFSKYGDLFTIVQRQGTVSEPKVRRVMMQLLKAVVAIHADDIAHRDIKLENIIYTPDTKSIQLTDFGLAVSLTADPPELLAMPSGSLAYISPDCVEGFWPWYEDRYEGRPSVVYNGVEVHRSTTEAFAESRENGTAPPYDLKKADVWACGVVMFAMLHGHMPFSHIDAAGDTDPWTLYLDQRSVLPLKKELTAPCKAFLRRLLSVREEMRPTAEEALDDIWLYRRSGFRSQVSFEIKSARSEH